MGRQDKKIKIISGLLGCSLGAVIVTALFMILLPEHVHYMSKIYGFVLIASVLLNAGALWGLKASKNKEKI